MHTNPLALFLVRHAEVEERYQQVFGGRIDMDLSPLGREQAVRLAGFIRPVKPQAIYASPMKRVQQTLAPLMGNGLPQPITLDGLREIDFGAWTGHSWEAVGERFRISPFEWLTQVDCAGIAEAECTADLKKRLGPCLQRMLEGHAGQRVVVYCHGGVIRVLLSMLLDLPLPRLASFEIDYASVTRVDVCSTGPRVQFVNHTPWREP